MCVGSTMSGPWGVNTGPNYHCSHHRLKYILIRVSMQLIISGCRGVLSGKLSDAIVRSVSAEDYMSKTCTVQMGQPVQLYMELGKRKVTLIVCE